MLLTSSHRLQAAASWLLAVASLIVVVGSDVAWAQRTSSADAIARMEEALQPAIESGALHGVTPVLLVAATPVSEDTRAWFPTAAASAIAGAFGTGNVRVCEACMNPRLQVTPGRMEQNTTAVSIDEILTLDRTLRGGGAPARAAIWVDETPSGVAVRVVSLQTSQLLFVRNFDATMSERMRSARTWSMSDDIERRARGDSLTHVFVDAAMYPGQHFSLDVVDQFGDRGLDMAGITMSAFDPFFGVGAVYYRVIPEALNAAVGVQVVASLPTLLTATISQDPTQQLVDPALTAVLVARVPIPQTNYAILAMASTNGRLGIGVSLLDFTLLPVLP